MSNEVDNVTEIYEKEQLSLVLKFTFETRRPLKSGDDFKGLINDFFKRHTEKANEEEDPNTYIEGVVNRAFKQVDSKDDGIDGELVVDLDV